MDGGQKSVLLKSQNNFNKYDNSKGDMDYSPNKYIVGFERNIKNILGKLYSNYTSKSANIKGMRNHTPTFYYRRSKRQNQSYTTGIETPSANECNPSFRKIDANYKHTKSTEKLTNALHKSFANPHIIAEFPNFPTIKRNRAHLRAKQDLLKRHLRRLSSNDRCFSNIRSHICNSVAIKSIPIPTQNQFHPKKKVVLLIPLLKNHIE